MTTAVLDDKTTDTEASVYETPEEAKARRNAEYLAKLEKSIRQHEEGLVFATNIEALEALTNDWKL